MSADNFAQIPHNIDAEKIILGILLSENNAYERVGDFLKSEHFFLPEHQKIYEAIKRLIDKGQLADPITLKNYFNVNKELDEIGGSSYLISLTEHATLFNHPEEYASKIFDLQKRRRLIEFAKDLGRDVVAATPEEKADEYIEKAEKSLYDLAQHGNIKTQFLKFSESLDRSMDIIQRNMETQELPGVTTGLHALDEAIGGLQKSDLVVLAGRPGMGKTALAINIGYQAARAHRKSQGQRGAGVAFFSLEMPADQISSRILSAEANIAGDMLRKGKISKTDFTRLQHAYTEIQTVPFFIDDSPGLGVAAIRTRARRLQRKEKIGLIIIDYIQLIGDSGRYSNNRVSEITEITKSLKGLAKELNIPILALSQLSRAVETREDKKPILSDLRESGSIEQDADIVSFIFRPEYYAERDKPSEDNDKYQEEIIKWEAKMLKLKGLATVIIAKNRHGPIRDIELSFKGATSTFRDRIENR